MNDGKKITGKLSAHWETGMEHIMWTLIEPEKDGYEGFHPIQEGDRLTVFKENGTDIVWQGKIAWDYRTGLKQNEVALHLTTQHAGNYHWVQGVQKDMNPDEWAKMFEREALAELEPAAAPV